MHKTLIGLTALVLTLAALPAATAQNTVRVADPCLEVLVKAYLEAEEPLRVSADRVTLEGERLHLVGNASLRIGTTTAKAREIVLNQTTKQVEFYNLRLVSYGTGTPCAPPPPPPVQFR